MIGQQPGALLMGDAKQRSALYEFLRDKLLVDPGCVVGGVRVAACSARERRRAVRLECEREVSQWRRRFEIGALDADVGSCAQQLQALLVRVQNTTAVHIKDMTLGELDNTQRRPAPRSAWTVLCVAAAVLRERCMPRGARVALLPAAACCARHAGQRRRRTCRREQQLAACCVSDAAGDGAARGLSIANVRASADCGQLSN
jgi:hypothetical protein